MVPSSLLEQNQGIISDPFLYLTTTHRQIITKSYSCYLLRIAHGNWHYTIDINTTLIVQVTNLVCILSCIVHVIPCLQRSQGRQSGHRSCNLCTLLLNGRLASSINKPGTELNKDEQDMVPNLEGLNLSKHPSRMPELAGMCYPIWKQLTSAQVHQCLCLQGCCELTMWC